MSIRKRGSAWWIDFTTPDGTRVRQSAGTSDRAAAQELHDSLKAKAWRVARLGERPSRSWEEAALRYLQKYQDRNKAAHIRHFTAHLRGLALEIITEEHIERALAGLARPYSRNRHAATLRHLFHQARDLWRWIDAVPAIAMDKEPRRRVEFLTREESAALLDALPPQHRDLVRFALATGLRLGNILGLTWPQIDADRKLAWIHPDQAKARQAISVPLNDTALEVLARQASGNEKVFDRGRIETRVWKRALAAAGITRRIRFHDLRHTWASWHIQQGTPAFVLQELGGWQGGEMVKRYAHLNADHLAAHAGRIESHLRHNHLTRAEEKCAK